MRHFRKPRTQQERKQELPTRAKRSVRMLPTAYDDLKRQFWRNWKAYRPTQYRSTNA